MHFCKRKLYLALSGAALAIASSNLVAQSNQQTVVVTGSRFEENLNEVPADIKGDIESAVSEGREAVQKEDYDRMQSCLDKLTALSPKHGYIVSSMSI